MKMIKCVSASSCAMLLALVGCTSEPETTEVAGAAEQVAEAPQAAPPQGGDGMGPPPADGMGAPPAGMGAPPAEQVPDIEPALVEVFKTIGDIELSAHVFNPEGHSAESSAPAMIFYHGGGFRRGSATQGYEIAERFIPEGVVVVAAEYRLLQTNTETLDTIVADAKSLVRWVRENADRLGVDPDRIVTSGHSAGSYLAMATAIVPGFEEASEDASISSVPNAMVLWSSTESRRDNPENSMVPEGYTIEDFSAPTPLSDGLPPAILIAGENDPIASPEAMIALQERYSAAGNQSSFHSIAGADHFFREPGQKDQVFDLIDGFLVSLGYINDN